MFELSGRPGAVGLVSLEWLLDVSLEVLKPKGCAGKNEKL